jgi:hypothetical protein
MPDTLQEPWFSFLKELDELVNAPVHFHCIGGFVVTMLYGLGRSTADVDVLHITPRSAEDAFAQVAMKGGKLHLKYRVYLDYVTVVAHPCDYESRLHEDVPRRLRHLHLMALGRDRSDVQHLARTAPFDLNILSDRYTTELRPYLLNPEREDKTLKFWIEDIEELRARP